MTDEGNRSGLTKPLNESDPESEISSAPSLSAPNEPWAWLATTVALAASLIVAMLASGAQRKVVWAGMALGAVGLGASITITLTQAGVDARRYLSVTSLLLTVLAMGCVR